MSSGDDRELLVTSYEIAGEILACETDGIKAVEKLMATGLDGKQCLRLLILSLLRRRPDLLEYTYGALIIEIQEQKG